MNVSKKWRNHGFTQEELKEIYIKKLSGGKYEAALEYEKMGWSVIPVSRYSKRPLIKWKDYQNERAIPAKIKEWWKECPTANVGIVTGSISGLAVVDCDSFEAFRQLKKDFPSLSQTFSQITGRGIHLFFKNNKKVKSRTGVLNNIDIKAEGGYVVAAPSIHKNGEPYIWIHPDPYDPFSNGLDALKEMPPDMIELFSAPIQKDSNGTKSTSPINPLEVLKGVTEGKRNDSLFRYAFRLQKQGLQDEEISILIFELAKRAVPPFPKDETANVISQALKYPKGETRAEQGQIELLNASDILERSFPEPKWAIRGILPEGLNILAGKPKIGKSMLALNIGIDITMGAKALGTINVEKGTVIYLALEDVLRRLQFRLIKMIPTDQSGVEIKKLLLASHWPAQGQNGLDMLAEEILKYEDLRLVIIDPMAMFRAETKGFIDPYRLDYKDLRPFKELADKYSISLLIIHHQRKTEASDVMDTFYGTFGITGAADGLLVLSRTSKGDILHVTGRDVEAAQYVMQFNKDTLRWQISGNEKDFQSSKVKQAIYDFLNESQEQSFFPKDISEAIDIEVGYVKKGLKALFKEGTVKKKGRGQYFIEKIEG